MSTLIETDRRRRPTDPATMRNRPYGSFIDVAFDRARHSREHRILLRWLYRAFRRQEHSTPFTARAQIATATMLLERRDRSWS